METSNRKKNINKALFCIALNARKVSEAFHKGSSRVIFNQIHRNKQTKKNDEKASVKLNLSLNFISPLVS